MKTALVLRHLAFEDLGAFAEPLVEAGYAIRYAEMGVDDPATPAEPDLLISLGGPIGAWQDDLYPWLADEARLIAARLETDKPMLGICLGAQLMARALGARVYPGPAKEIGFSSLTLSREGRRTLSMFQGVQVLHWHGDTFDLPKGAVRLASTPACENQAFAHRMRALAFQFHPEAQPLGFERWLIGHCGEIAATPNVSVPALRRQMRAHGAATAAAGRRFFAQWLQHL